MEVKEEKKDNYLIVVRYDSNCDVWIIDEDSRHVLENYGNGMTPQELQVCSLKALPQSVPWQDDLPNEEEKGPIFEWIFENPEWIGTMGLLYKEKDESEVQILKELILDILSEFGDDGGLEPKYAVLRRAQKLLGKDFPEGLYFGAVFPIEESDES